MNTLLLSVSEWDLVLDAKGNIAMAEEPYALAQDVASAIKTFLGEVWYNTELGVPYFQQILGRAPTITVFKQYLIEAALTVPGVVTADCTIQSFEGRTVAGQVIFTDSNGQTGTVTI
jgi:hypothetical protein